MIFLIPSSQDSWWEFFILFRSHHLIFLWAQIRNKDICFLSLWISENISFALCSLNETRSLARISMWIHSISIGSNSGIIKGKCVKWKLLCVWRFLRNIIFHIIFEEDIFMSKRGYLRELFLIHKSLLQILRLSCIISLPLTFTFSRSIWTSPSIF